jgi:hypothetical protein
MRITITITPLGENALPIAYHGADRDVFERAVEAYRVQQGSCQISIRGNCIEREMRVMNMLHDACQEIANEERLIVGGRDEPMPDGCWDFRVLVKA